MAKKRTFTEQLKHLIDTCGETRYRVAVATGVHHATLSRFMNDKGGLSMANLDVLADYLGWQVTTKHKKKGR